VGTADGMEPARGSGPKRGAGTAGKPRRRLSGHGRRCAGGRQGGDFGSRERVAKRVQWGVVELPLRLASGVSRLAVFASRRWIADGLPGVPRVRRCGL